MVTTFCKQIGFLPDMITTSYLAETLSTYLNVENAVFAVESIFVWSKLSRKMLYKIG